MKSCQSERMSERIPESYSVPIRSKLAIVTSADSSARSILQYIRVLSTESAKQNPVKSCIRNPANVESGTSVVSPAIYTVVSKHAAVYIWL